MVGLLLGTCIAASAGAQAIDSLAVARRIVAAAARAALLVQHIATVVGGALETFPSRPPSLVRGAAVYQEQCAQCHGPTGRGDGPKAKHLQGPAPASLADRDAMSTVSPLDVYRK